MKKKFIAAVLALTYACICTGCGENDYSHSKRDLFSNKDGLYDKMRRMDNFGKADETHDEDVFEQFQKFDEAERKKSAEERVIVAYEEQFPEITGYWRSTLSDDEKKTYDRIYAALATYHMTFKIDGVPEDDVLKKIVKCIKRDHTEIFWLATKYLYLDRGYYMLISFEHYNGINDENIEKLMNDFDAEVDKILDSVPDDADDYEKALFIHDYLVNSASYEIRYETLPNARKELVYNAYGCIVNHKCVCQGYAEAFKYLMDRLGIEAGVTTGGNHAWNYIKLGGEYYWIDCTWDDPVYEGGSDSGKVSHKYFCITSEKLLKDHTFDDEKENLFIPECTADEYSYSNQQKKKENK